MRHTSELMLDRDDRRILAERLRLAKARAVTQPVREVGPHPRWSYQIAFEPMEFSDVVGWLALNHGALDVFVHPNTDNELRDHRDCAIWLGRSYQLDLSAVGG